MDLVSLGLSKKYTEDTVIGLGAIKGAPATISKIEKVDGGNNVTFSWTANDGSKTESQTIFIADGEKGEIGPQGPRGPQGPQGPQGKPSVGSVLFINGQAPNDEGEIEIPVGITKTTLWENASPASLFASQTLVINLEDYDEIEVEFSAYGAHSATKGDHRIKITVPNGVSPITKDYISGVGSLITTELDIHRSFRIVKGELYFLPGFKDGTANGNYMVPTKIYGIKGVQ